MYGRFVCSKYEVVCTESYLDVGLCIETDRDSNPALVLAPCSIYSSDYFPKYGGVEYLNWIRTGVFLNRVQWRDISYNKSTPEILNELGIKRRSYEDTQELQCSKKIKIALLRRLINMFKDD